MKIISLITEINATWTKKKKKNNHKHNHAFFFFLFQNLHMFKKSDLYLRKIQISFWLEKNSDLHLMTM